MRKIVVFLSALCVSFSVCAQLSILNDGTVNVGNAGYVETVPLGDKSSVLPPFERPYNDTISLCNVYSPIGNDGLGRIAFKTPGIGNPFAAVGEIGDGQFGSLGLHGQQGFCFTMGTIDVEPEILFYFDKNKGNQFLFNYDLFAPGVSVVSDTRLASNIERLEYDVNGLYDLTAVSYKLKSTPDKIIEENNNPVRFGFMAQQVEDVYPDLVRRDPSGLLYIDYIGMIPLLVDALQKMKSRIDSLETVIERFGRTEVMTRACGMNDENEDESGNKNSLSAILYQNNPNPWSAATEIRCSLPFDVKAAYVYIYDLQGQQIGKEEVVGRGDTSVSLRGTDFKAGMYIYALVVDGKEVDTKRMILTD